jgi:alpha-glucosidase
MKIIDGKMGEYIIIARKIGNDWYVAGQTNWNERKVAFSLPFIENASEYTVEYITDGINANKDARDYILKRENAAKKDWQIRMAQGGGFAIKLKKK